jgi:hypothetical protein
MRKHGWFVASVGRLAWAGAVVVAGLFTGTASAQPPVETAGPPLKWAAQERYLTQVGANANDEGMDIVYWNEDPEGINKHWIYVTGWVTELQSDNGAVKGTRFATYKYDATFNGPGAPTFAARAYFPPNNLTITQGDTYKAVAMVVVADPESETSEPEIYITGEGPHTAGTANNQDYFIVKYDKDLAQVWGVGVSGARKYEGPVAGNDIPVDIGIDVGNQAAVVTGTSPGSGTGLDIATVAWHDDGTLGTDLWPVIADQPVAGVRRYDYGVIHDAASDDDRAVELGPVTVALLGEPAESVLEAIILGTTWAGASKDDFTTHRWSTFTANNEDITLRRRRRAGRARAAHRLLGRLLRLRVSAHRSRRNLARSP